jgi:hypothetical protein
VGQRVAKGGKDAWRRIRRAVTRLLLLPLLRAVNKVLTKVAAASPQAARIDSSALLRAGFVEWLGLTSFAKSYMPALSTLSQRMARWFLSRFDEGQLMGLMSMAGTELIAREVQRQIEPLPPDVQRKAVALSERMVGQLETKLVEFGQVNWLMDAFMDKELKKLPETLSKVLSDPWNSLPILQEPESRSAMAEILSAKAEVEARRVLSAIGLTEKQSVRFLELNATRFVPNKKRLDLSGNSKGGLSTSPNASLKTSPNASALQNASTWLGEAAASLQLSSLQLSYPDASGTPLASVYDILLARSRFTPPDLDVYGGMSLWREGQGGGNVSKRSNMLGAFVSEHLSSEELSGPGNLSDMSARNMSDMFANPSTASLTSYLSDLRERDADRYLSMASAAWQATGSVSWEELWDSLFASAPSRGNASQVALTSLVDPLETALNTSQDNSNLARVVVNRKLARVPLSSLRFLESVSSEVAISPASLGMLRDAAALKLLDDALRLNQSGANNDVGTSFNANSADPVWHLTSALSLSLSVVASTATAALQKASIASDKMWSKGEGLVRQAAAESLRVLSDVEALVGSARPAPSQDTGAKGEEGAERGTNNGSDVRGQEMQQNMQQVMQRAESSMPVLRKSDIGRGWRHTLVARVSGLFSGVQAQRETPAAVTSVPPTVASPSNNSFSPISSSIAAPHSPSSSSSSAPPPAASSPPSSGPPSIADL